MPTILPPSIPATALPPILHEIAEIMPLETIEFLTPPPTAGTQDAVPETPALATPPTTPQVNVANKNDVAREARNMFLTSLAGTLRGRGLTPLEARETLLMINAKRYGQGRHPRGPLSLAELEKTVFKSLEKWQPGRTDQTCVGEIGETLPTLHATTIPPRKWIVPGILPEGLTLLVGNPKAGKSFFILNLALAVSSGIPVMGKLAVPARTILYLGLEDSDLRLQERSLTMLNGHPASDRFIYRLEWDILTSGGLEKLKATLETNPEIEVVFIDTLAKVRGVQGSGGNVYQEDYALMGALQKIAKEHHIALVLVHHTNKRESSDPLLQISGSSGMAGAADTLMVLKRIEKTPNATLYITGRDVDTQELALTFQDETLTWFLQGQAEEQKVSQERQAILDLLREAGDLTPAEIAEQLEKPNGTVRAMLRKMLQRHLLVNCQGRYALATPDATAED